MVRFSEFKWFWYLQNEDTTQNDSQVMDFDLQSSSWLVLDQEMLQMKLYFHLWYIENIQNLKIFSSDHNGEILWV